MPKTLLESLNYQPVELTFGTSGLRGLAKDMTDLECYINTLGFIEFLLRTNNIRADSPIALAGDLRESTPRILLAVAQAILDAKCRIVYLGKIPTPAAADYGLGHSMPVAMITGSHIPGDRNGIKFYKLDGEVLKTDEEAIKASVDRVRKQLNAKPATESVFDSSGSLRRKPALPKEQKDAASEYIARYTSLFNRSIFQNKTIIVYQHSSLAADMLIELCESLGAVVVPVGRSDVFIPIDTENVTPDNQRYFKSLAQKYPQNFAIISADGDADRPFVIDEAGTFHRGDVLGAVVAEFLHAKAAAVPISASDAVDSFLNQHDIKLIHTKIGSPFVISAMNEAISQNFYPVVGWEVNGGFLTASNLKINNTELTALPTRDAFLPIVCALAAAVRKNCKISELFAALPKRFTQAGLLDNFPVSASLKILAKYSANTEHNHQDLQTFFGPEDGFGKIININNLDGVRISFRGGDIAHIRPSGNAPQLRVYSVANSQKRADDIISIALAQPNGILRSLEKSVANLSEVL